MASALAVLLAGCAPATNPDWTPPQPTTGQAASIARPADGSPSAPQAAGTLDPASVPGLSPQRLQSQRAGIGARWTYLPGGNAHAATFNERLDAVVQSAIDDQRAHAGTPKYAPAAQPKGSGLGDRGCTSGASTRDAAAILGDPASAPQGAGGPVTALVCDVVVAGGTFFGERIRIVEGTPGAVTRDTATTIVTDTATGELVEGRALFTPDAAAGVYALAVAALRHEAGALWDVRLAPPSPAALDAVDRALDAAFIGPDGSLQLAVPGSIDAPELASLAGAAALAAQPSIRLSLPAGASSGFLTPFAQRLAAAAAAPYAGPADVAAAFDRVNCALVPCVALTFDDGPEADTTGRLLDTLAQHGAAASFFLVGRNVAAGADLIRREQAEGHTIGTHTWSHPMLTTLGTTQTPAPAPTPTGTPGPSGSPPPAPADHGPSAVMQEVTRAIDAVAAITGSRPVWFRPPYGDVNDSVLRDLARVGVPAIDWDVDTNDWQKPGTDAIVSAAATADAGSIILMHDIHATSVDAVPAVLDALADRGMVPVTLDHLFGGRVPAAGTVVRSAR